MSYAFRGTPGPKPPPQLRLCREEPQGGPHRPGLGQWRSVPATLTQSCHHPESHYFLDLGPTRPRHVGTAKSCGHSCSGLRGLEGPPQKSGPRRERRREDSGGHWSPWAGSPGVKSQVGHGRGVHSGKPQPGLPFGAGARIAFGGATGRAWRASIQGPCVLSLCSHLALRRHPHSPPHSIPLGLPSPSTNCPQVPGIKSIPVPWAGERPPDSRQVCFSSLLVLEIGPRGALPLSHVPAPLFC